MQAIKDWIKRTFPGVVYGKKLAAARKQELETHLQQLEANRPVKLSDASFDVFTYHGEDGIIAYLLRQLKYVPPVFADIGAGDCITGNSSCLAVHYGWQGLFIDMNGKKLSAGKKFYSAKLGDGSSLKFTAAEVTPENVNELLSSADIPNNIGVLSIDVDGNDYWIWKAIGVISPAIVVIESKVEFGFHDVIVPYGKQNHRAADLMYNGASAAAFEKLGKKKGYKLAGANKQGYNLFFVKEPADIKTESLVEALGDEAAIKSFYPDSFFKQHEFVTE